MFISAIYDKKNKKTCHLNVDLNVDDFSTFTLGNCIVYIFLRNTPIVKFWPENLKNTIRPTANYNTDEQTLWSKTEFCSWLMLSQCQGHLFVLFFSNQLPGIICI